MLNFTAFKYSLEILFKKKKQTKKPIKQTKSQTQTETLKTKSRESLDKIIFSGTFQPGLFCDPETEILDLEGKGKSEIS